MHQRATLVLTLVLALLVTAAAQHGGTPPAGPALGPTQAHGGQTAAAGEFHFEIVSRRNGIQIHGYDAGEKPIDLQGVEGTVELSLSSGKGKAVTLELKYAKPNQRRVATESTEVGSLVAAGRFARVQEGTADLSIHLKNLPGENVKEAVLRTPFQLARSQEYACPMNCVKPQAGPGNCAVCRMALVGGVGIQACATHRGVTSHKEKDRCWICKGKLERIQSKVAEATTVRAGAGEDDHDEHGDDPDGEDHPGDGDREGHPEEEE